jgi:hypothetical protein
MSPQTTVLNTIRAAMLIAIVLYIFIGEKIAAGRSPASSIVFQAVAAVSVATVVALFVLRRMIVLPAFATLQTSPNDARALSRWRAGYIGSYALCEALALYGFALRVLGFPFSHVVLFYVASLALLMYYRPQLPQPDPLASNPSM